MNDVELAGRVAREAGQLLLQIRADAQRDGLDGAALKDKGDHDSNVLILERLRPERPDDSILWQITA